MRSNVGSRIEPPYFFVAVLLPGRKVLVAGIQRLTEVGRDLRREKRHVVQDK
jgi:hypothetical protein